MANNGSMAAVYAGRFIAGIGIGETVVVGPVYLSEISPAPIRGLCTCMFTGAVYIGILTAYLANWGAEMNLGDTYNRWVRISCYRFCSGNIFANKTHRVSQPRSISCSPVSS